MILSYPELVLLVEQGVITNVQDGAINGSSIDVRLGGRFLEETAGQGLGLRHLDLSSREPMLTVVRDVPYGSSMFLDPGEFTLAHTMEAFNLPNDISAEFKLKSSVARCGLNQLTAVWCDPGWNSSVLTLELSNVTQYHRLLLKHGMAVGQMTFHRHTPVPEDKSYSVRGRYNRDTSVSGIKP